MHRGAERKMSACAKHDFWSRLMKTSVKSRIKLSDMNLNSELKFGSMIDLIQDCINHQSESAGLGVKHQISTKKSWILSSWYIEIEGQFEYDEEVVISTWPYEFKGVCGRRNATIARVGSENECIIKVDSLWAVYDMEQGRLTRVPDEDARLYSGEEPLEMNYQRKKILKGNSYEKKDSFTVRKYQMDFNRHMNNAWYIKIAEEYVEKNSRVKAVRAEYKKAALLGETINSYVSYEEDRVVVELRNDTDEVFAIMEFRYQ